MHLIFFIKVLTVQRWSFSFIFSMYGDKNNFKIMKYNSICDNQVALKKKSKQGNYSISDNKCSLGHIMFSSKNLWLYLASFWIPLNILKWVLKLYLVQSKDKLHRTKVISTLFNSLLYLSSNFMLHKWINHPTL